MNETKEIHVGLVQIGENFNGQYYLPYSIGLLLAYARKYLKNAVNYNFSPPLYKRLEFDKILLHLKDADIVFFSVYMWNFNFSLEIARRIKLSSPDCFIVFGGPQIPEGRKDMESLLRKYPFINIACYGEGENPFVEILENFKGQTLEKVSSIGYIKSDNSFVQNKRTERISDLNLIPSPYLDMIFDSLMKDNPGESWSAMWESNRGCPFSCAYCAWGNGPRKNVYQYDMDRVSREIDWFSKNKIEFIFCCDANFGLFKDRDMQIVDKVVENKNRYGYPKAFSVQSTKNATKTIFEIQRKLNASGLQKGVNLALQSVNQQTLKSVNRSNISTEQFRELQRMFTDAGIATFSDMILGLPDETYDSFLNGVSSVIEGGQHNRIQFINLALLKNTEMDSQEYIDKFGLVLQESKLVSHHTTIGLDNQIPETQTLVVATKSMPKDDWVKTRSFCWMASLLHFDKLLQIPFVILNRIYSISYRHLIEWFLIEDKNYPIVSQISALFKQKALSIQSGDVECILSEKWLNIYWPVDEFIFIKLCTEGNLLEFYNEAKQIISKNLVKLGINMPNEQFEDAFSANFELIKQPFITKDKEIRLHYNILDFYQAILVGKESTLNNGIFTYEIKSSQKSWKTWADWCKQVVWFGTKKGDYLYQYLNSNINKRVNV